MSRRFNIQQLPTGSYDISGLFSGSFIGDGSALNNVTASLAPQYTLTSSFTAFTASYLQDSASFDTRILNNSGSIAILSSSFIGFSGSYVQDSASFDTRILVNSSSISTVSSSFNSFTQTYNTGSFTGSFIGDGSQLTGIVSSKWSGSNPITRESDVEITGSLRVSGSTDIQGPFNTNVLATNADTLIITGSFFLTGSMQVIGLIDGTASLALTASYIDGGFY